MHKKRINRYFVFACISFCVILSGIYLRQAACEEKAHTVPNVEKINIRYILEKDGISKEGKSGDHTVTEEEYEILSGQTGLSRKTAEKLIRSGRTEKIYDIQEMFFKDISFICEKNTPVSCEEFVTDEKGEKIKGMLLADIEDGDILYTANSHTLGWRNGHAAIVTDAEKGIILEAQVLGSPSAFSSAYRWESYPSFTVLRLKDVDTVQRREIARYAAENLKEIPYRLTSGIFERSGSERVRGTHCSHLVWKAYEAFGYDLDSDGGIIVTPKDLLQSPLLETVQVYGMPIMEVQQR